MRIVLIVVARDKSAIPFIMWGVSGLRMDLDQETTTSIRILRACLEGKLDSSTARVRWTACVFVETNRNYNTLVTETKHASIVTSE